MRIYPWQVLEILIEITLSLIDQLFKIRFAVRPLNPQSILFLLAPLFFQLALI